MRADISHLEGGDGFAYLPFEDYHFCSGVWKFERVDYINKSLIFKKRADLRIICIPNPLPDCPSNADYLVIKKGD
jgi:hypothetical protein